MVDRQSVQLFFLCHDTQAERGGQRDTYQHVDDLNAAGFAAFVMHRSPGYRLTWFNNETRVTSLEMYLSIEQPAATVLVVPEDLGSNIKKLPGQKVIYNKNVFYGFFHNFAGTQSLDPYLDPSVIAVITVSDHNRRHIQFTYPHLQVFLIYPGVSTELLARLPMHKKKKEILMVNKALVQTRMLTQMLRIRGIQGLNTAPVFQWNVLAHYNEREAAEVIRKSCMLLYMSTEEGLGKVVVEAQMAGSIVVAFDCAPLSEVVPSKYLVRLNDLVGFCRVAEKLMSDFSQDPSMVQSDADAGHDMARRFTLEAQRSAIARVWAEICDIGQDLLVNGWQAKQRP